jgi:hypothetical protein
MSSERLIPVFIPTLVSMLLRHERDKGAPLTEMEVIEIRDKSIAIMLRESIAREMARSRGYDDIDPERCWSEWQRVRAELV